MVTVLKLGGSIITNKDEPETIDSATLAETAETIGSFLGGDNPSAGESELVIVHGGGSFGHHHAANHGVSRTDGTTVASVLFEIHRAMGELNDTMVAHLQDAGVPAVPVRPLSVAYRRKIGDGTELAFPSEQIKAAIAEGFVPVVQGDVIVHEHKGGTVLSGDEIVVSLARSLGASRIGLCSTVPGVLDADDSVIPEIESYDDVANVLEGSNATDVTGGMAGKVQALLALETPAAIFAPAELEAFLRDGTAGTTIR